MLIVLGSANRDYTVVVERHPLPGETVLGASVAIATGGKGANQAAAASRAGAKPILVGAIGSDSAGDDILADLVALGVDTSHLARSGEPSGVAFITVSADGENEIVVAPGANSTTGAAAIDAIAALADDTTVLLAQLEIPVETVERAAQALEDAGGRLVLNLSPFTTVSPRLLGYANPLVLNVAEASELAGSAIDSPADAEVVARRLLASSHSVAITLGSNGAIVADADGVLLVPAGRVAVVDTTGAGDAFAGALAAALASGGDLRDAVRSGVAAGSAAVQHPGAQPR